MAVTMVVTNDRTGGREELQFPSITKAQEYAGELKGIMKAHGLPTDILHIEITE